MESDEKKIEEWQELWDEMFGETLQVKSDSASNPEIKEWMNPSLIFEQPELERIQMNGYYVDVPKEMCEAYRDKIGKDENEQLFDRYPVDLVEDASNYWFSVKDGTCVECLDKVQSGTNETQEESESERIMKAVRAFSNR